MLREVHLPFSLERLAVYTVLLPLIGFGFCLSWSFIFDYEVSFNHTLAFRIIVYSRLFILGFFQIFLLNKK